MIQTNLKYNKLIQIDNMKEIFKKCHDYIYGNQGLTKEDAFNELNKIIFCKIYDETKSEDILFHVTDKEMHNRKGLSILSNRINSLFTQVKNEYGDLFNDDEKIILENNVLSYIVSQFQKYSFVNTDIDIKGAAYEELFGENIKGDKGEFFTPRNVCRLCANILLTTIDKTKWNDLQIIDPACGTGGFFLEVINILKNQLNNKKQNDEKLYPEKILNKIIKNNIKGIDINPLLAKATKMNEVLYYNQSGPIFSFNSLINPINWPEESKESIKLGTYDLLLTNPPFGSKIPIDDPEILSQYDIAHLWKKVGNDYIKTEKLRKKVPPEQLFIERSLQLLKPNGKMAIVLPDSILSNPGLSYIRYWIRKKANIISVIDLPEETFQPFTGVRASILFLEKKDTSIDNQVYDIFMAKANVVGKNRRGNILYKRDYDSGEIIQEEKEVLITSIENGKGFTRSIKKIVPIVDDDLPIISDVFSSWYNDINRKFDLIDCTVITNQDVISNDGRLDAYYYVLTLEITKELNLSIPTKTLESLVTLRYLGRFKRDWVKNSEVGYPYLSASEIFSYKPLRKRHISKITTKNAESYFTKKGWVLVECSGTIGIPFFVGETHEPYFLDNHLIRLIPNEYQFPGYIFSYLSTDIGQKYLKRGQYGAVVKEIDPRQVGPIPIPMIPKKTQEKIHDKIVKASKLRDEANRLEEEAIAEVEASIKK